MKHTPISRREFLKNIGMTGAGVLLAASPWLSAFSEAVNTMRNVVWGLLDQAHEVAFL